MSKESRDLGAIVSKLEPEEQPTVSVDVSQWLGNDPETDEPVRFVYREPDLAKLFLAYEDAQRIRQKVPDWPNTMCQSVAYLIHAHESPPVKPGDSKGMIYIRLAQEHPKLFRHLWTAVNEAFVTAGNLEEAAKAREGECETPSEGS